MRFARILVVALLAAAPFVATALDPPHDLFDPTRPLNCMSCHQGHNAPGGALTTEAGNASLCQSCHSPALGGPTGHGFPWYDSDQADFAGTPATGSSHRWDALATNRGATAPDAESPMGTRLDTQVDGPHLTCSVCHDQHNNTDRVGGSLQSSYTLNVDNNPSTGGSGRTVRLVTLAADTAPKGYLIQIVTGGAVGTARFKVSNDGGGSWSGCSSPSVYWPYQDAVSAPPDTANGCNTAANVPLNGQTDNTKVRVTFAGSMVAGDQWKFYVTTPFLRISNQNSEMCVTCHQDRNMSHTRVAGDDPSYPANGSNVFSHPVGNSLNANGGGYDRGDSVTNEVLDANGGIQATAPDGIASNDIRLGANNTVHCMSCHSPHNADSNSLTETP